VPTSGPDEIVDNTWAVGVSTEQEGRMSIKNAATALVFAAVAGAYLPVSGQAQALDGVTDAFNAYARTTTRPVVLLKVSIIANVNKQGQTNGWLITENATYKNDPNLTNVVNSQMACVLAGGPPATISIDGVLVPSEAGVPGINCSGAAPVSVTSLESAPYATGIPCSQKIELFGTYFPKFGLSLLESKKGVPYSSVYTYCTVKGKQVGSPSPLAGYIGQITTVLNPYGYVENKDPAGNFTIYQGDILALPTQQYMFNP